MIMGARNSHKGRTELRGSGQFYADYELDDLLADPALGRDSFTGRCPCCNGPIPVELFHDEVMARVPCANGCQVVDALDKRLAASR
jgi:hypothetical protein